VPDPVLIILHQEHSDPGRVGQMLQQRGYVLDIRKPRYGDPLPETLENHSGAVIFGGPMSVNDKEDYIRQEIDWIDVPLKENKPFLGICLGAQMLAKSLGAEVRSCQNGMSEVGYYPIHPTLAGQNLMDWPEMVYHWHTEGFTLPESATLLAQGPTFHHQAIQVGEKAFGIQFHPELTLAMMHRWTTKGAHMLNNPGAQPRVAHFAGRHAYDEGLKNWLSNFLDLWLS
jgi:GMP synthase (glutamine-hydrolysing)